MRGQRGITDRKATRWFLCRMEERGAGRVALTTLLPRRAVILYNEEVQKMLQEWQRAGILLLISLLPTL